MSTIEKSLLFDLCEEGDIEKIKSILNNIPSNEISLIRDNEKATIVHYICRYGHLNLLQYLIEIKQININKLFTKYNSTCLHDAAVCDQINIVKYLFNNNEKIPWSARDEQGNTPLHIAARYNSINVLNYLIEEELADPNVKSYNGYLPLHYASECGNYPSVQILLRKCPSTVNQQTNELLTPIHLATKSNSFDIIIFLIKHGANLKLKEQYGLNCLHIACQYNHYDLVRWFIEKQNANRNDIDYRHLTPMHYAAIYGNEQILNYLLENNSKLLRDSHGNTPLHLASQYGHQNVCAILIERACCSLDDLNLEKLTPADLAEKSGYSSLANQLRLRQKSFSSSNIQLEKASIVRLVIKKRNIQRADKANQVNEQDLIRQDSQRSNQIFQQIQNGHNSLQKSQSQNPKQDISTTTNNGELSTHHYDINGFSTSSTITHLAKSQ